MIREVVKDHMNVEVQPFNGLAVHFVKEARASMMIRGLRTVTDMDFEFSMSLTNQTLDPTIETVFLLAKVEYSHLSSTLIRQIASLGGDLNRFLPASVVPQVEARARDRRRPGELPHEPSSPADK
jgi:pantetheine-phosphate adenylyltransferase